MPRDGRNPPDSTRRLANTTNITFQGIESEALPLADRLRVYRDLPRLIGRDVEDLDWQRLALERSSQDNSPDDEAYDRV
jgi:hypothetical protein